MNVLLLLILLWSLVEVHSQTAPYVTFMGETLPNHAFVDLSLVGDAGDRSDSVQCHTDLSTCCSGAQGADRGDWYFPSGDRLNFQGDPGDIYMARVAQRVDIQSSKLHAAIGHFPCALLERPTVIPRVRFQRPIQILFAPSVLPTV